MSSDWLLCQGDMTDPLIGAFVEIGNNKSKNQALVCAQTLFSSTIFRWIYTCAFIVFSRKKNKSCRRERSSSRASRRDISRHVTSA